MSQPTSSFANLKHSTVVDKTYGEGDTTLVLNILPEDIASVALEKLKEEVKWNKMYHRGGEVPRLVAVEGEIEPNGSVPVYRHPADETLPLVPYSPIVQQIRKRVEEVLNQRVNHALIQHYRHGGDYISEHSDKTIDIAPKTKIVNVSFGAQRTMTLRTKRDAAEKNDRSAQRVPLPDNSMFVMGLETNAKWLHSIRTDKRPDKVKLPEERGERISLTFRLIDTFLADDCTKIYGQGATGKTIEEAKDVLYGGEEGLKLIQAFGEENQTSDFDWKATYGQGADVFQFKQPEAA